MILYYDQNNIIVGGDVAIMKDTTLKRSPNDVNYRLKNLFHCYGPSYKDNMDEKPCYLSVEIDKSSR